MANKIVLLDDVLAGLAKGSEDASDLDGLRLSYEHGWLCIRDDKGWLLWAVEGNAMPEKGLFLNGVITDAVRNIHVRMPINPRPGEDL